MQRKLETLADLTPDPKNARRHTPRNVGMIVDALHEVGAARSIVVDEDGVILAGNATVEAAAEAGIERVQVVDADGETIVAVRRTGLTKTQKARLALFDNRTAELAEWDTDVLKGLDADEIAGMFSEEELEDLLASADGGRDLSGDPDDIPDDAPATCVEGDLWQLGDHRVLCGDSRDEAAVRSLMGDVRAKVMVADPPYGVGYVEKARDMHQRGYGFARAARRAHIIGDAVRAPGAEQNYLDLVADIVKAAMGCALTEDAAIYCWHAQGRAMRMVLEAMHGLGVLHHQTLIWVKNNFVIGRCHYQWKHEPCFYGWKQGSEPPFYGGRNQHTIWECARDVDTNHPTQKPVGVILPSITNHSRVGDVVYDPCLGSGSTLVAAEQAGRACYGVELDPHYCDVIIERWQRLTGGVAQRIGKIGENGLSQ